MASMLGIGSFPAVFAAPKNGFFSEEHCFFARGVKKPIHTPVRNAHLNGLTLRAPPLCGLNRSTPITGRLISPRRPRPLCGYAVFAR
jgi:hypothetical protein